MARFDSGSFRMIRGIYNFRIRKLPRGHTNRNAECGRFYGLPGIRRLVVIGEIGGQSRGSHQVSCRTLRHLVCYASCDAASFSPCQQPASAE